jgi:hypothetical protein
MGNYRPITDTWFLARAKLKGGVKFYGAYLGGFPERARALLGCNINDPVLHVCGGMAKLYPYKRGFGPNDKTLDLDPQTKPDFLRDAREPWPLCTVQGSGGWDDEPWKGILIDPPYSVEDAGHYAVGPGAYPSPVLLVKRAFEVLPVGGRVGIIHYMPPSPPKNSVFVAAIGVMCGFNNRIRVFSVFEKTESVE